MSAPYGLTSTSFAADVRSLDLSGIRKGRYSVESKIALAVLSGLADELRVRGYKVESPGVARKVAIASFKCASPRLMVDFLLTVSPVQDGIVECKVEPIGRYRTWKEPPYEEIWRDWVSMRAVVDEYLTRTFHLQPLRWGRARAYCPPTI